MIPIYEAVFKEGETEGVYGISLVENPAMEDEWIALSEHKKTIEFAAVDEKKKLLLGAVLIPNKKVYRNIDGNEFYITFTEETIGELAHNFIKGGNQNNSSAEHEVKLSDVSFVQSWQVEDESVDKSALYGKNYPKGTWVVMAKVSDEIYKEATNGTFKGFSIDALLGLEQINFNKHEYVMKKEEITSLKDDILNGIKAMFSAKEEVTNEIEVQSEEVVSEVSEETEQEETVEATEENSFDVEAFKKEMADAFGLEMSAHKTEVQKELDAKDAKIAELELQLSKQPEQESVIVTPEQETKSNNYEYGKNRPASISERVFASFNN